MTADSKLARQDPSSVESASTAVPPSPRRFDLSSPPYGQSERGPSHGRRPSRSTMSPSTPSTSSPGRSLTHTPRRSVAHNPELLGLGLGNEPGKRDGTRARSGSNSTATTTDLFNYEAESEADCYELHRVDLDDMRNSIELQQQRAGSTPRASSSALQKQVEQQEEDEEDERHLPSIGNDALPSIASFNSAKPEALRLDDEPFSGGSLPHAYQEDNDVGNGYGAPEYDDDDDFDDDDLERGLATNQKRLLHFESITPREKAWMWTSVGLVTVLTVVSIAISVDWIDWPGDGLGKY